MSSNFVSIQPIRIEEGVPVFQPTWLEFRDFFTFLQSIENYGTFVGLLKIIPPKEWTDLLMVARQKAAPIENTSKENDTLLSSDSFNEKGSAQLHGKASVQSPEKRPLSVSGGNYDHTGNLEEMIQRYGRTSKVTRPIQQSFSGENGLFRQLNMEMGRSFNLKDFKKFADSQLHLTASNLMKKKIKIVSEENSNGNIKTTSVSKNSNSTSTEDAVLGLGGYTREKLLALEKLYWKTLPYNEAYYGADLSGSLFPSDFPHWNMQKLPCLLRELGILLPGVNSPYLYFGAWKATFAWHVEDMDLFSINYLHFGAPKQWYSISCSPDRENIASSSDRLKFESAMRSLFPADYQRCRAFLRHKTFVASPDFLQKKHDLRVNRVTQFAGEIMITFPYGYHQGFNYGFNCAEAVNFALPSWVEKGQLADYCVCVPDSVRIKIPSLIKNVLEVRKY